MMFLTLFELSVFFAFVMDLIFADPEEIPHPVVIIGKGISFLEKHLRRIFPDTPSGKRHAGRICAAVNVPCPPAVPIAVSGERINEGAVKIFQRYVKFLF